MSATFFNMRRRALKAKEAEKVAEPVVVTEPEQAEPEKPKKSKVKKDV